MGAIPCTASGTVGQVTLTPFEPIPRMVRGLRVSWRHFTSGNISTGKVPGAPVRLRVKGLDYFDVWGPDGHTKCGVLDFHQGGFCAAEWWPELAGGFGGWVLTSPTDTLTQSKWHHGQCRFVSTDAKTVYLHGFNGYGLLVRDPHSGAFRMRNVGGGISQRIDNGTAWIDGVPGQSLAPNTLWYAYATDHEGGLRPDFSTIGHGTDPNLGIEVKATDPNCTYVGILYTKDGVVGPFTGMNGLCLVSSWFNRQSLATQLSFDAAGVTQTAAGPITAAKLCLVTHADDVPNVGMSGWGLASSEGWAQIRADMIAGEAIGAGPFQRSRKTGGHGSPFTMHGLWRQPIPEGYIEIYPEAWVDTGSADFNLTVSAQVWL